MKTEEIISLLIDSIKNMDQIGDPNEKYRISVYWKDRFFEYNWLSTGGQIPEKKDDQLFSVMVDAHFNGKWHTVTVIESLVTVDEGWDTCVIDMVGRMFGFGILQCVGAVKESLKNDG